MRARIERALYIASKSIELYEDVALRSVQQVREGTASIDRMLEIWNDLVIGCMRNGIALTRALLFDPPATVGVPATSAATSATAPLAASGPDASGGAPDLGPPPPRAAAAQRRAKRPPRAKKKR